MLAKLPIVVLLFGLMSLNPGDAQTLPAQPAKSGGLKLPDGAIIVFSKTPDDANATPDGVFLSAADYQAMLDKLEAAKKARENSRTSPSAVEVRGVLVNRGTKTSAKLSFKWTIKTTTPRSLVALGLSQAAPLSARWADGKLPLLSADAEGLQVLVETPGEAVLVMEAEVPVTARGAKGDLGFELGLPRAAMTSLAWEVALPGKKVQLNTRWLGDKPTESRTSTEEPTSLVRKAGDPGIPLGPIEWLEVQWENPTPSIVPAVDGIRTAEVEIVVRVEENQIETIAKFKLRGPAPEWLLALPATADILTERLTPNIGEPTANTKSGLTAPTDPAKPVWSFRPTDPTASWLVTAVLRQQRPNADKPEHRGPFELGPATVVNATRTTGTLKVLAPPTVRVLLENPTLDLRRTETTEEDVSLAYKFASVASPVARPSNAPPFAVLRTKPLPGFQRVQPTLNLRRMESGWRMQAEVVVTPVRAELEQVLVDVPVGWQAFEAASSANLIDEVRVLSETPTEKRLAVLLTAPQKAPFTLNFTANFPGPNSRRREELPLLTFPNAKLAQTKLLASVPDGFEITGTARTDDGTTTPLVPLDRIANPSLAPKSITATTDLDFRKVELQWQPYRPELLADSKLDMICLERQANVTQTVRLKLRDGDTRPVLFSGNAVGLRLLTPNAGVLEPLGREAWQLRLPAEAPRDMTLSLAYAIPWPAKSTEPVAINYLRVDSATRNSVQLRLWAGGGTRSPLSFAGPWQELPPEASAERDNLPRYTLFGQGESLPLSMVLGESDGELPKTIIDRQLVQHWLSDEGQLLVRCRAMLVRWPSVGVDVELPGNMTTEVFVDGRRTEALQSLTESPEARTIRITMPEARPAKGPLLIELRLSLATRPTRGKTTLPMPKWLQAQFKNSPRVQSFLPRAVVPLGFSQEGAIEQRWTLDQGLFRTAGVLSPADAEAWFRGSETEPEPSDSPWTTLNAGSTDSLTTRPVHANLTLWLIPKSLWFVLCSLPIVLFGLVMNRLRTVVLGVALVVLALLLAVGAMLEPHLTAQIMLGIQPGLWLVILGWALALGLRWYYRQRVTNLPGFTRQSVPLSTTSMTLEPMSESPSPGSSRSVSPPTNQVLIEVQPRSSKPSRSA
ncbi:MAG: hypothetical protein ACRC8S_04520 [Fimbriiglobus sp.]